MRPLLMALLLGLILVVGACGGGTDRIVRTGPVPQEQDKNGALKSFPTPLTLSDVARQPPGSARAAVMSLLFWAQWGSTPNVLDAYEPAVVSAVGAENMAGAFDVLRTGLVNLGVRIVGEKRRGRVTSVRVQLLAVADRPRQQSFDLIRVDRRWLVIHDSYLVTGLATYGQLRVGGDPARPSRRSQQSGERLAARYRTAFVPVLRGSSG